MDKVKTCPVCLVSLPLGSRRNRVFCSEACRCRHRWPRIREQSNERRKKYRLQNPEKHKITVKQNYDANKDRYETTKREWAKKNKAKILEYRKKTKERSRRLLTDYAVVDMLRKHDKTIDPSQITDQAIRLKRVQVQITRTLKEQQNEASNIKRTKR